MASMKLYNQPSFGYGASQSNHSKYQHQERRNTSQSSQVEHGWAAKPNHSSTYYGQAQGSHIGYDNHEDDSGLSWANDSTHQYAQAQTILPMPSMIVQQSQHMMEKKESRVAQEWGTHGGNISSPVRANRMGGAMVSDAEGWATKPNPNQTGGYGASMYNGQEGNNYQYGRNGSGNGGWANKPNGVSGPNQMGQSAQMMYGRQAQQGWANSPNKLSSPAQANHSSVAMHKEEHMMGKMGNGWAGSPVATNHSSQATHKEEHMMAKMGNGWAGSPVVANHSTQAMHKEEHIMENIDNGWATSPTNANHSSFGMHQEDQGWGGASPARASLSSLSMRKEEHMMGETDHGWVASPTTKINHSSQAMMHKEDHKWASNPTNYTSSNNNNSRQGWAGNHSNSFGPAQTNHSAHAAYNSNECDEDHGVDDILDEILTNYPAHNVSNGLTTWAAKPNMGGMGQSQASSYAKQEAWAQSAHSGGSAQSSMASSNASKFAMSSGNRSSHRDQYGGYQGVGNHSYRECDD